ncbi:MAG: cupredoxin domain-containing protein [Candidatus Levybacteria bacterium]|nr:cupredoxin domain-containing protein [Candidatus Levybacteria bacterium]
MNTKLIGIVGVVVVLVIAAVVVFNTKSANQNNTSGGNPSPTVFATPTGNIQSQTTNVQVSASGFEPQEIKIKKGARVVWTNTSGAKATVSSDVHPTHLLFPFLNLGAFEDKQSVSVIFEKPGTYTYHNHFKPSQTGTVVVE